MVETRKFLGPEHLMRLRDLMRCLANSRRPFRVQLENSFALLESEIALLDEVELDASGGEEGDHWFLSLSNNEDVA